MNVQQTHRELVFAVDLDGVVIDYFNAFINLLSKSFNRRFTERDFYVHDPAQVLDISHRETEEFLRETVFNYRCSPIQGSLKGIKTLKKYGELIFITERTEDMIDLTKAWLKTHGYPLAPIEKSNRKSKIISKLNPNVWIEDNLKEIIDAPKGTKVLLFDRPWNRRCLNVDNRIIRTRGWSEIITFIEIWIKKNELV